MRVYEFFRIPDCSENDKKVSIEERYTLYAITNNKEYAERFQQERDMSQFIMNVHKHVSKEEYRDLCNEERSSVLEEHELATVLSKERSSKNLKYVKILMTYWEWQLTKEPIIYIWRGSTRNLRD